METGIIMEIYRLQPSLEVQSDFYLITDPFCEETHQISLAEAKAYIAANKLTPAITEKYGRIFDTKAHRFKNRFAASKQFPKKKGVKQSTKEARKRRAARFAYKKKLFETLDRVWGADEEVEDEQ